MKVIIIAFTDENGPPTIMIECLYTLDGFIKDHKQILNEITTQISYTIFVYDLDANLNDWHDVSGIWDKSYCTGGITCVRGLTGELQWHYHTSDHDGENVTQEELIELLSKLANDEQTKMLELEANKAACENYIAYLENHLKYMPDSKGALDAKEHFLQTMVSGQTETPHLQEILIEKEKTSPGTKIILLTSHYGQIDVHIIGIYTLNGFKRYLNYFLNELATHPEIRRYDHEYTAYILEPNQLQSGICDAITFEYTTYRKGSNRRYRVDTGEIKKEILVENIRELFKEVLNDSENIITAPNVLDSDKMWYVHQWPCINLEINKQAFKDVLVNDIEIELKSEIATKEKYIKELENQIKCLPDGQAALNVKADYLI